MRLTPDPDAVGVSVLFNESKLLKCDADTVGPVAAGVSVLFNESKLLKFASTNNATPDIFVSVLFNESKLLKCACSRLICSIRPGFSTLQRVEIAEIETHPGVADLILPSFSTLQRVEIAEIPATLYGYRGFR